MENRHEDPNMRQVEEAATPYPTEEDEGYQPESEIERVLQEHEQRLLSIDGVVGVGIDENGIVIYLRDETAQERVPDELEGFPVTTRISGEFEIH